MLIPATERKRMMRSARRPRQMQENIARMIPMTSSPRKIGIISISDGSIPCQSFERIGSCV